MIDFLIKHPEKIIKPLLEHFEILLITMVISLVLAVLFVELAVNWPPMKAVFNNLFTVVYSIPSIALFSLLIPLTGLGKDSAIIVLVFYNQYILVKNILTGIDEVNPGIQEAARGIGMTTNQSLWRVLIPLAKKSIFAGIRLATVSTVGIGTIAACISAGGLGTLLFDGLRTMNTAKILWGSILSAGLAILMNSVFKAVENKIGNNG